MILAADALHRSLRLDVEVKETDGIHTHYWQGGRIEGFYNANGAYSSKDQRIQEVVHMPWLVWADTDVPVAVAALHTDDRPFVRVFTNRPRTPEGKNSHYRPIQEHLGGSMLASEVMAHSHSASRLPESVSQAVDELEPRKLFRVQALDTGSFAVLTAQLTIGAPIIEQMDVPPLLEPVVQAQLSSVQSQGLVMR